MYVYTYLYIYLYIYRYTHINHDDLAPHILLELVVVKLVAVLVCEVVAEEEEIVLVTVPDVRVLEDVVPLLVVEPETSVYWSSLLRLFYWKQKLCSATFQIRLVPVDVDVEVGGQPFCSLSQHHSFFKFDQLTSQLL